MPLTQPYISTIPAFDAGAGTSIQINVLGGDTIDKVTLDVYGLTDNTRFTIETTVTDTGGDGIRTFSVALNSTNASQLSNGKSYQCRAYTTVGTGSSAVNSISSSMKWFTCYTAPAIGISWYDTSSGAWKVLSGSAVFPTDSIKLRISFSGNITMSTVDASLIGYRHGYYNIDGTYSTSIDDNYEFTIDNLRSDTENYTLTVVAETTEGMVIRSSVQGVRYTFTDNNSISSFTSQNWCAVGKIRLAVGLDSSKKSSIYKVVIRRQESGSSGWVTACTIKRGASVLDTSLEVFDHFAGSGKNYQYRATAYDSNGNTLSEKSTAVYSEFYNTYIGDADNVFTLESNWSISDAKRVQSAAVYDTYSRKYPVVAYNARLNYASQTTSAILLTAETLKGDVDGYSQTEILEGFNDFLTNGKPKFMKDFNGNIRVITVIDSVTNDFDANIGNALATTSFSWVEIAGFDSDSMAMAGFGEGFIYYSTTYTITYKLRNVTSSNNATSVSKTGTYSTILTANSGYTLTSENVTITMGGVVQTDAYNASTGAVTLPALTGNIVIFASAVSGGFSVQNNLAGVYNSNMMTTVAYGSSYSGVLSVSEGYSLGVVTIYMGGTNITSTAFSYGTNTIHIPFVTGNIIINASATSLYDYRLTINEVNCTVTATTTRNGSTVRLYNGSGINGGEVITWSATAFDGYVMQGASSGTITVTGNTTISASATEVIITYTVTKNATNCTISGADTASYGVDYTATINPIGTSELPSSVLVTIGGYTQTAGVHYTWNQASGVLRIYGSYITGDIVITASATAKLSTPQNLTLEGATSSWDSVDHAETYELFVGETSIGTTT